MLFNDLSITAMDNAIAKYRNPQNPKLLCLNSHLYEFTPDGELIEPPEVVDRFGKKVKIGDIVTFVKAYSRRGFYWECGRVLYIKFINKNGSISKAPRIYTGFLNSDPDRLKYKNSRTVSLNNVVSGCASTILVEMAKNDLIKLD
jgi:hypothetical protein